MKVKVSISNHAVLITIYSIVFIAAVSNNLSARQYVHMDRPKLGIKLSYEVRDEKRTNPFDSTTDTYEEFKEELAIETKGWIYHPALCEYSLGFEPSWRQFSEEHEPGNDGKGDVYFPGYFLDATLFNRKPLTLHLFGNRRENDVTNAFSGQSETTTDTYGTDLSIKSRVLPTSISYSHLTSSQTGFYTSEEDRDDAHLIMRHFGKKSDTRLKSIFSDNTRTSQGITNHTKTSNSYLRNKYNIEADRKIWLNSILTHRWTEINLSQTSGLRLDENLFWNHRKNLRSHYNLSYDTSRSDDFKSDSVSLGAGLTHGLYENLTTTVSGSGVLNDSTSGKENRLVTGLDLDYRRRIPWGTLNLSTNLNNEITHRNFTEKYSNVTDESHILRTGDFTLLDNENIDVNTVQVTNAAGSVVYIDGIDYVLQEIDNFVRISRNTFGAIADGQQILVSYIYLTNPDYDDDIFSQTYGINFWLWKTWYFSYRYSHAKQHILSGVPPDRIINNTFHSAEIRFLWNWSETKFFYDDIDTASGISTRSWFLEEELTFRPARQLYLKLSGRYGNRKFIERDDEEDILGLRSNMDWLPARWCKISLVSIRDHVSSHTVKTTDINSYTTLEFFYRIWTARIRYDFLDQKDDINQDHRTRNFFKFEIIRTLW